VANQNWSGLLNWGTAWTGAGTALSSAATATISPQPASNYDFPVQNGGLYGGWYPGLLIEVTARGYLTTTSTAGSLTWFLGANTANGTAATYTTLATTAALTTTTAVFTGIQWKLEALIRCTAIASTGNTISTQGELVIGSDATAPTLATTTHGLALWLPMPATSGETAVALNTASASPPLGIALRCTQATSACTVQLTEWVLEGIC
jgi:hypothetical protein